MTSNNGKAARFGGFRLLSAPELGWLKAGAMVLLFAVTVHATPLHAAPAATAHVYLVRGVLNVFSLGMDQIAARLRQQGIIATVHNHMAWAGIADDAAAEYRSGRANMIILVGHSSGATSLPDIVARLDQYGVPVKLAIGLDSVFQTSLSGRVERYINFYIANGQGTPVQRTGGLRGTLENVDVETVPGVSHTSIDKNEVIQQKVIAAIDAAVARGPTVAPTANHNTVPAARKRVSGVARQPSRAKRAAAAN